MNKAVKDKIICRLVGHAWGEWIIKEYPGNPRLCYYVRVCKQCGIENTQESLRGEIIFSSWKSDEKINK